MKKIILVITLLAVAGAGIQTAKAGDREWATVGKVLTGVVAGAVIANAVDARANVSIHYSSAPTYAYCPPGPVVVAHPVAVAPRPVVYAPAPVVYAAPRVVYAPAPAPVVVYRAPVYVAPRPVVVKHSYHKFHRHHGGRFHR